MSLYIFDTDILTHYQLGQADVCRHVKEHESSSLATTIISVDEQLSSWYTLVRRKKNRDELAYAYQRFTDNVQFLSKLTILTFRESAIDKFEELKKKKLGVKAMDLRIAAITLDIGGILVTRNQRDYKRVPELSIEDWMK